MFRLAGHLGKSVAWIADNITSRELSEWMAVDATDPIGLERADYHAAQICQMLAAGFGDGKKTPLKDFVLDFGAGRSQQKRTLSKAAFMAVVKTAGYNIIDKRGGNNGNDR